MFFLLLYKTQVMSHYDKFIALSSLLVKCFKNGADYISFLNLIKTIDELLAFYLACVY